MTTNPGFAVEVDEHVDPVVVSVRGELDMSTAPGLAEALADAAPPTSTVVVDLSAVSFLDSSAIGTLVTAGRSRNDVGGRLQIGARSAIVERVLEITGLGESSDAFDVLPQGT
jgi:anti-sigma B factor antagonist